MTEQTIFIFYASVVSVVKMRCLQFAISRIWHLRWSGTILSWRISIKRLCTWNMEVNSTGTVGLLGRPQVTGRRISVSKCLSSRFPSRDRNMVPQSIDSIEYCCRTLLSLAKWTQLYYLICITGGQFMPAWSFYVWHRGAGNCYSGISLSNVTP